jgi:hypothetical protein
MLKILTITTSIVTLVLSLGFGGISGFVALEATKSTIHANQLKIKPDPLTQNFGNLAIYGLVFSFIIGSTSAMLIFKSTKW